MFLTAWGSKGSFKNVLKCVTLLRIVKTVSGGLKIVFDFSDCWVVYVV